MKAQRIKKAIFLAVLLPCWLNFSNTIAQDRYLIPGDARRGWYVFSEKGCIQCHGMGESSKAIMAPDLSKSRSTHISSAGLAAEMWTHAPEMWGKMPVKWLKFNKLKETEMADIFAFLYFIRYLDEKGSSAKGKEVLETKGCTECHSIGERSGKIGPDLAKWSEFSNPILWLQMMWNHALKMKSVMDQIAKPWPILGKNDVIDIIAYISSLNKKPSQGKMFLSPGDPVEGKNIFSHKGCAQCHSTEGAEVKSGPNLGVRQNNFPPTMGQFASLMWNHFPGMFSQMQMKNIKVPELYFQDIANITSYLFSIRYFDPAGDEVAGRTVFQEKRCDVCHDVRTNAEGKKEGPNLAKLKGMVSPIYMATALWNHGPKMMGIMKGKNIKWQKISDNELINLMEYFNKGD